MLKRHSACPGCGCSDQKEGLFCHQCGESLTFEDHTPERASLRLVRRAALSLRSVFNTVLAILLLVSLGLVFLWFWGNRVPGSTMMVFGLTASFEAEERVIPAVNERVVVPRWPPRGPVAIVFNYVLSPPEAPVRVQLVAADGRVLYETTTKTRFLFGDQRMALPMEPFDTPSPVTATILHGENIVALLRFEAPRGDPS